MFNTIKVYWTFDGVEVYEGSDFIFNFEWQLFQSRLNLSHGIIEAWCIQRASDGIILAQSKERK